MTILGPASATAATVGANLPVTVSPLFRVVLMPILWETAEEYGIDPVGMVAQAAKETGWGHFTSNVRPEFHNTAGIKLHTTQQRLFPGVTDGDNPLAHAMFATWRVGAHAQAQHLCAYTNQPLGTALVVDPRYSLVGPPYVAHWSELGGRWAPSPDYGIEIEQIIWRLRGE